MVEDARFCEECGGAPAPLTIESDTTTKLRLKGNSYSLISFGLILLGLLDAGSIIFILPSLILAVVGFRRKEKLAIVALCISMVAAFYSIVQIIGLMMEYGSTL